MYKFRKEKRPEVKTKYKLSYIADEIGINVATLSRIINGRQTCKKVVALCITKMIKKKKEINEYFEQI